MAFFSWFRGLVVWLLLIPVWLICLAWWHTDPQSKGIWQGLIDTVLPEYARHSLLLCLAVSVGVVQGVPVLDLDYVEDSACDTDMNVVMTGSGGMVEVQGTAEGKPFTRDELNALLEHAQNGIRRLIAAQRAALGI